MFEGWNWGIIKQTVITIGIAVIVVVGVRFIWNSTNSVTKIANRFDNGVEEAVKEIAKFRKELQDIQKTINKKDENDKSVIENFSSALKIMSGLNPDKMNAAIQTFGELDLNEVPQLINTASDILENVNTVTQNLQAKIKAGMSFAQALITDEEGTSSINSWTSAIKITDANKTHVEKYKEELLQQRAKSIELKFQDVIENT